MYKRQESIWYQVFKNCTSLKSVTLNDGLMYIYDEAFGNCSSLSDIELPESIQKVSSTIFLNCDRIGNMYDHFAALNNKMCIRDRTMDTLSLKMKAQ